jgi:hypothetical protein
LQKDWTVFGFENFGSYLKEKSFDKWTGGFKDGGIFASGPENAMPIVKVPQNLNLPFNLSGRFPF